LSKPGATGLTRIINAFGYSMLGIRAAFKHEAAFRQELLLAVILIPLAFFITQDVIKLALLITSPILVLVVEILNSAIEAIVDRFGGEHHELSGRAKDMGSAAVLFSLIIVAVIWGLIIFDTYF
jgi:diacylglycerol kinase (ATP)